MVSSSDLQEVEAIDAELKRLGLKQQQLSDRQALLAMLQGFKETSYYRNPTKKKKKGEDTGMRTELQKIEEQLETLADQEEDLMARKDEILFPNGHHTDVPRLKDMGVFVLPRLTEDVLNIAPPPSTPAPQVILDVENLPPIPSHTQCPSCYQFVITETFTKVGNIAWLTCFLSVFFGCVAGCCLIPFCIESFKDVIHRCPKCRTHIHTVTNL